MTERSVTSLDAFASWMNDPAGKIVCDVVVPEGLTAYLSTNGPTETATVVGPHEGEVELPFTNRGAVFGLMLNKSADLAPGDEHLIDSIIISNVRVIGQRITEVTE